MNAADVVGFTADANVYCPECAELKYGPDCEDREDCEGNPVHPIFAGSEWGSPTHCCECDKLLPVSLSGDGMQYVLEAVSDYCANKYKHPVLLSAPNTNTLNAWLSRYPLECQECGKRIRTLSDLYGEHETGIPRCAECFGVVGI